LARIEAGERSESFWERLVPKGILRPIFASGFGLAACAMLALGVNYALKSEDPSGGAAVANAFANPTPPTAAGQEAPQYAGTAAQGALDGSSTNPIITEKPLFNNNIRVLPAGYPGKEK